MFRNKQFLTGLIATIIIIAIAIGGYFGYQAYKDSQTEAGAKSITVRVIYDNTVTKYELTTDEEFLGPLLESENIIPEGSNGFVETVDGRYADFNNDGEWWQVFYNAKPASVGINDLAIKDNDSIFIVLTVGWSE